jgi:hypothetical protein
VGEIHPHHGSFHSTEVVKTCPASPSGTIQPSNRKLLPPMEQQDLLKDSFLFYTEEYQKKPFQLK